MALVTPATRHLDKVSIPFETVVYPYDPKAASVGLQAAEAIGEHPRRVLKTLIVKVDGKPACIVLPSDHEASMKRVASVFKGKSAEMMPVPDAERLTGYKVGGVSPFGQKRRLPTVVEETALEEVYVFVNGGQRGLQLRLKPSDLLRGAEAKGAALIA
ncbi:MAG: Cys-tRNA(Pro) deacylase [Rhodospirillum sp.]|nr:Cys-tRNA(Pro) deacylase [Rhodospirillum sp.]MCF8491093.1 Cys-tRNA(Pro) deacylase [Rhodospirillum sp.]MCF8501960.1 Cys-tRNA(Pro) deacylase [Rhodospirillum sp.]